MSIESKDLNLQAFKKNIHLMTQSLLDRYESETENLTP